MSKVYLLKNVLEASIDRLQFVSDNFERVVVAFSGGKDSTLTLALARRFLNDGTITYFWDKESNLISTARFVEQTFDSMSTPRYWFCLPYRMRNALSVYEPYWYCWDETCPERWIYRPPDKPYVVTKKNNFLAKYDPERHNLYKLFAEYVSKVSDGGKYRTAILVGLRADESLNRFRAVTKNPQFGHGWIAQTEAENCYNVYPIYDWSFGDVWTYINKNSVPYAPVYDAMFKAGLYKRNMRISQSFCDVSKQGIPIIREIEPESFERFLQRLDGVNSLTHVNLSDVLKTAKGVDYDFLLQLYPEPVRNAIQRRIERSRVLNADDPNVIRALLNNDIRLKRVNREPPRVDLKEKYRGI